MHLSQRVPTVLWVGLTTKMRKLVKHVGVGLVKLPTMSTPTRQTKTKATANIVRNINSLPNPARKLIPRPTASQTLTPHVDTKYMKSQTIVVKIVLREEINTTTSNTNVLCVDPESLHLVRDNRAKIVPMVSIIQNMASISKKHQTPTIYHIIYITLRIVQILVLKRDINVFWKNILGRREHVPRQISKRIPIAWPRVNILG